VKDFAFKIHILAGDLERVVVGPVDVNSGDNGGLNGSGSDSDGGAPPYLDWDLDRVLYEVCLRTIC
jgi:hypothetical protein